MTATIAIDQHAEGPQRSHALAGHNHNPAMDPETTSCLQNKHEPLPVPVELEVKVKVAASPTRSIKTNPNPKEVTDDPLAHPEAIEVVQQSDTTFVNEDEDGNNNDISTWSYAPIRNLMGAFEDMSDVNEEQVLLCPDHNIKARSRNSPNGIEQYESPTKPSLSGASRKASSAFPNTLKIHMPPFDLYQGLRLGLTQPVLDRCSFYSVIHGVNKEVQDMASHDQNCHVEEEMDESSALVRAVNGPVKKSPPKMGPNVELAVIDEEKFLLAAIASRTEEEVLIRDCPQSFAEAIGESDALTVSDESCLTGHSENPLSVVSASRTQLWKPSRSWWEAKSGKNPWIEPTLHNKRWRFLWPLIHYHKFLAKCIKKLKRNQVDVKTSLSPVSAFLREEVCAVSDHLASVSKFTSEDWMDALPNFNGWIDSSGENEKVLKDLVKMLPMRRLDDTKECVETPAFRKLIDDSFHKAMDNNREQMLLGQEEYEQRNDKSYPGGQAGQRRVSAGFSGKANRPPRHGSRVGTRPPRNSNRNNNNANRPRRQHNNAYPGMHHPMMNPMNMSMQSIYSYDPYQQGNHSAHYMPPHPENDYYYGQANTSWMPMPHGPDYENPNFSYLDQSMVSTDMQYYQANNGHPATGNWVGVPPHGSDASASICVEDLSQCSEQPSQICAPEGVSLSFLGPKNGTGENCKTPSKNRNTGMHAAPPSPYWGHLNMATLAMSGLASPGGRHPPSPQHFVYDHNDSGHGNGHVYGNGQLKPPLINNYNVGYQGVPGMVPPSPATQFMMSSQVNRQNHAYFGPTSNPPNHYSSPMKNSDQSFSSEKKITGSVSDEASSATTEASSTGDATRNSATASNDGSSDE